MKKLPILHTPAPTNEEEKHLDDISRLDFFLNMITVQMSYQDMTERRRLLIMHLMPIILEIFMDFVFDGKSLSGDVFNGCNVAIKNHSVVPTESLQYDYAFEKEILRAKILDLKRICQFNTAYIGDTVGEAVNNASPRYFRSPSKKSQNMINDGKLDIFSARNNFCSFKLMQEFCNLVGTFGNESEGVPFCDTSKVKHPAFGKFLRHMNTIGLFSSFMTDYSIETARLYAELLACNGADKHFYVKDFNALCALQKEREDYYGFKIQGHSELPSRACLNFIALNVLEDAIYLSNLLLFMRPYDIRLSPLNLIIRDLEDFSKGKTFFSNSLLVEKEALNTPSGLITREFVEEFYAPRHLGLLVAERSDRYYSLGISTYSHNYFLSPCSVLNTVGLANQFCRVPNMFHALLYSRVFGVRNMANIKDYEYQYASFSPKQVEKAGSPKFGGAALIAASSAFNRFYSADDRCSIRVKGMLSASNIYWNRPKVSKYVENYDSMCSISSRYRRTAVLDSESVRATRGIRLFGVVALNSESTALSKLQPSIDTEKQIDSYNISVTINKYTTPQAWSETFKYRRESARSLASLLIQSTYCGQVNGHNPMVIPARDMQTLRYAMAEEGDSFYHIGINGDAIDFALDINNLVEMLCFKETLPNCDDFDGFPNETEVKGVISRYAAAQRVRARSNVWKIEGNFASLLSHIDGLSSTSRHSTHVIRVPYKGITREGVRDITYRCPAVIARTIGHPAIPKATHVVGKSLPPVIGTDLLLRYMRYMSGAERVYTAEIMNRYDSTATEERIKFFTTYYWVFKKAFDV